MTSFKKKEIGSAQLVFKEIWTPQMLTFLIERQQSRCGF
jgi:hypothetical protein